MHTAATGSNGVPFDGPQGQHHRVLPGELSMKSILQFCLLQILERESQPRGQHCLGPVWCLEKVHGAPLPGWTDVSFFCPELQQRGLAHPEASSLSLPSPQILNLSYTPYANGNTQASPPQTQTDTGGQTCLTVLKGPGDLGKPLRCRGHYLRGQSRGSAGCGTLPRYREYELPWGRLGMERVTFVLRTLILET